MGAHCWAGPLASAAWRSGWAAAALQRSVPARLTGAAPFAKM